VRAARLLRAYDPSGTPSPLDYGWRILEEIRISGWNKWSILVDVTNRCVYYNTEGDRGIRRLRLDGIDFSCSTPARLLDVHSSRPGDVSGGFADYTYESNLEFLEKRTELLFQQRLRPLTESGVTAEIYAKRFAEHPERTSCVGDE
jgi:hypothetical protein